MADEDRGVGNPHRFPAVYLEWLYRLGEADENVRIRGDQLNLMFNVKHYKARAWYIVTEKGVKKL